MNDDDAAVLTERRERVLVITLNRPDQRNAVNARRRRRASPRRSTSSTPTPELSVGIVTGAGKGFCAGMDLKAFVAGERRGSRAAASPGSPSAPRTSR